MAADRMATVAVPGQQCSSTAEAECQSHHIEKEKDGRRRMVDGRWLMDDTDDGLMDDGTILPICTPSNAFFIPRSTPSPSAPFTALTTYIR